MMAKEELLRGFFYRGHNGGYTPEQEITIKCDTLDEMRAVMDWLIENEGMTLDDDYHGSSFARCMYDGREDFDSSEWHCITCRSGHREWFDFYSEKTLAMCVPAIEFFEIVSNENSAFNMQPSPLNVLFGDSIKEVS